MRSKQNLQFPLWVNTVLNAGRFDIADAEFNAWLDDLGVSTSNRGLESQSTEYEEFQNKFHTYSTGLNISVDTYNDRSNQDKYYENVIYEFSFLDRNLNKAFDLLDELLSRNFDLIKTLTFLTSIIFLR